MATALGWGRAGLLLAASAVVACGWSGDVGPMRSGTTDGSFRYPSLPNAVPMPTATTNVSDNDAGLPNVLVLLTDDQRHDTVHALGNQLIQTPNIDRLAHAGTSFTQASCQGGLSGAVCITSRAALMTGRTINDLDGADTIPVDHTTLPELLRQAGYFTFATGKWHNDIASHVRIFDYAANIFFGGMHFPEDGGQEHPLYFHFDPTGIYPAEAQLPDNFLPEHPFDNGELHNRDEDLLPIPRDPVLVRKEIAAYYGMISEVDAQIGRILDALEQQNLRDRTLVIFAGDNGLALGSHGLLGKQNVYDDSVRVPMIISGPGIAANVVSDRFAYLHDLLPTVASLLGIDPPMSSQGNALLNANAARPRQVAYHQYRDLHRAIRTVDDLKFIGYRLTGGAQCTGRQSRRDVK